MFNKQQRLSSAFSVLLKQKRIIFLQKRCFCNREISWSMQFPAWMLVHLCYPEQKSNKDPSKTLEICKKVAKSYQVPSPAVLTIPGRNGNFATSGLNGIHLSPFTSPAGISFSSLFEAFLSCMSPTQNHIQSWEQIVKDLLICRLFVYQSHCGWVNQICFNTFHK